MQTTLTDSIKGSHDGRRAEEILRKCVHCGFCTATCPTYQLLGDELDGPRGRIYLIKSALEGGAVTRTSRRHLDRCLTCRSCETTCPSGVRYGQLLDIGREFVEQQAKRPLWERAYRFGLRKSLASPWLFGAALTMGRPFAPLLPSAIAKSIPPKGKSSPWPRTSHARQMVVLDGCVQPALAPNINAAAARVLDRLGIELKRSPGVGCCGAIDLHLSAGEDARRRMRANIDAWWPSIENGVEAIVMTASGCGVTVREYADLLEDDPVYGPRAARLSALVRDLSEVVVAEDLGRIGGFESGQRVAFHSPCSLQHGQGIVGAVERILESVGFDLLPVKDSHLCCGSAGTYSLLQPKLSEQLLQNKLSALQDPGPDVIATANIGCLNHLQSGSEIPVRHWIEVVDEVMP